MAEQKERLEKGHEFRFEVDSDKEFEICLQTGSAELFGVELAVDKWYKFYGQAQGAVFTWYGCTLQTKGEASVAYVSDETPMTSYINLHAQLESRRDYAHETKTSGPRILIAGPTDAGKSSLCRILLNYALRLQRKPTYIDLDVGQNDLTIPGAMAATPLDINALSVEEGFRLITPLNYFYGHNSPSENPELYKNCIDQLAKAVSERMKNDPEVNSSGFVINTCGFIEGVGFRLLEHAVQAFQVDIVLVLGQDRLYSEFKRALNSDVTVLKIDRSGGVVPRSSTVRRKDRMRRIREYFYGPKCLETGVSTLSPATTELSFDQIQLYKITDVRVSGAMVPVGQAELQQQLEVIQADMSLELSCSIVAITHTPEKEINEPNDLLGCPTAGFIFM